MKVNRSVAGAYFAILITLGIGYTVLEKRATVEAAAVQAPMFEVDPLWPKPLPNHWVIGSTIGLSIDSRDNVWIIHRGANLEPKEIFAAAKPPAACRRRPFSNTTPPVISFSIGADLGKATHGQNRITGSPSITKATSGLAGTVEALIPLPPRLAPREAHGESPQPAEPRRPQPRQRLQGALHQMKVRSAASSVISTTA